MDGELTQQQRQRVELHCETCADCRAELKALRDIRQRVGEAQLPGAGEDRWRETIRDFPVRASRGLGWLLAIGGCLALGAIGVVDFLKDPAVTTRVKLLVALIYGGGALLFVSVLRQRLIERRSDKYKDVEI